MQIWPITRRYLDQLQRAVQDTAAGDDSYRHFSRAAWYVSAILAGVAVGIALAAGDLAAVVWGSALVLVVVEAARRVAPAADRKLLITLTVLALAVHMSVALFIHALAPGFDGGFVTGDDAAYFRLSSDAARVLRGLPVESALGPPLWGGQSRLFGTFVYLETALFVLFGPDARVPLLLNGALAVVSALLIYGAALRMFSRGAVVAAAVVSFYPSLVLWSSLNLKDALTISLTVLALWAVTLFLCQPRAILFSIPWVAAVALISLRSYVAVAIAVAVAASEPLARGLSPHTRVATAVLAAALCVVVSGQSLAVAGISGSNPVLEAFERTREAMAAGARTGFLPTTSREPAASTSPSATAPSGTLTAASPPPTSPAATFTSPPQTAVPSPSGAPSETLLGQRLSYLPTGLFYALAAPVPGSAKGTQERIAAAEMILWYVILGAAIVTAWHDRRRWRFLVLPSIFFGMMLLVLALAEGNIGTLFRHRGMLVPFVALVAGPTLSEAPSTLERRVRGRFKRGRHVKKSTAQ